MAESSSKCKLSLKVFHNQIETHCFKLRIVLTHLCKITKWMLSRDMNAKLIMIIINKLWIIISSVKVSNLFQGVVKLIMEIMQKFIFNQLDISKRIKFSILN